MPYYLSADGGGTKLQAVLFDHRYRRLGSGTGGAVNFNYDKKEHIRANMRACFAQCMSGRMNLTLEHVYIAMPGAAEEAIEALSGIARVKSWTCLNEGSMCLHAGILDRLGCLALSGTGSAVYWEDGPASACLGGWGSELGDDGSGYGIGRDGIAAAIQSYEGWGPETALTGLLMKQWKLGTLRDLLRIIYGSGTPRTKIASAALIVSEACASGDPVAAAIYRRAGEAMARQALALLRRMCVPATSEFHAAAGGGAWKGSADMFDTFKRIIQSEYPNSAVHLPLLEPVIGGVIAEAFKNSQEISNDFKAHLLAEFHEFRYLPPRGRDFI